MRQTDIIPCATTVRAHDKNRFLITSLMPKDKQEALLSLFAFNYEIAKTSEVVTEPQLGRIRLQWWRDEIDDVYRDKKSGDGGIMHDLRKTILQHNLKQEQLHAILDGRELDFSGKATKTVDDLIAYADQTTTPLNTLAQHILNTPESPETVRALSIAYALISFVRNMSSHAQSPIASGTPPDDIETLCKKAEEFLLSVRPTSRFLKLTKAMTGMYGKQLKRLDYNPYCAGLMAPPFLFHIRLLWTAFAPSKSACTPPDPGIGSDRRP